MYSIYLYLFLDAAAFLMHLGYMKQASYDISKQFLNFFTKNFWGKVDINYKSVNMINLVL